MQRLTLRLVTLGDTFTCSAIAAHARQLRQASSDSALGLVYSFNPTTGVLSVVAGTAELSTNITSSVSGSTLSLLAGDAHPEFGFFRHGPTPWASASTPRGRTCPVPPR